MFSRDLLTKIVNSNTVCVRPLTGFLSFVVVTLVPMPTQAQWTFTNIADTTTTASSGNFTSVFIPSLSGNMVAFQANYNDGANRSGIFARTGSGALTTIATTTNNSAPGGANFTSFQPPNVNGSTVVFWGRYFGADGIFTGTGGTLTPVVTTNNNSAPGGTNFNNLINSPSVSGNTFALVGFYAGNNSGIFTTPGSGPLTTVARTNNGGLPGGGNFTGFTTAVPGISGNTVAFVGNYSGGSGIFTRTGSDAITTIVTTTDNSAPGGVNFTSFTSSTINGNTVAFGGSYSGGSGIFTRTGSGPVTTIATTTDNSAPGGVNFTNFSNPSLSGNRVAFRGNYNDGANRSGVFVSNVDGLGGLSSVIRTGDSLFGSTVSSVGFSSSGLDGNNLAFSYTLASGVRGVAVASFASSVAAPEPGSLALLLMGVPGLAVLVRRKK